MNDFNFKEKVLIPAALVFTVVFLVYTCRQGNSGFIERHFSGVVRKKVEAVNLRMSYITLKGKGEHISIDNNKLFHAIDSCDIIIKEQGRDYYMLIKNGDTTLFDEY